MYAFFNSNGSSESAVQFLNSVSKELSVEDMASAITYCEPDSIMKADINRLKPEELVSYIWSTRYSEKTILVKLPADLASDQFLIEKYHGSYLGCLPQKAKRMSLRSLAAQCKKIKSLEKYRKHFSLSLFVNKSAIKDSFSEKEIQGIFSLQAQTHKPAYRLIEDRISQLKEELFRSQKLFIRNF